MKLKVYKTKEIDGEVFSTKDLECEYNIDELRISTKAFKQLFKIIKKDDLNMLLGSFANKTINEVVISKLYDILEDDDDELIYFIKKVLIENGYYITGDQLSTIDPEDIVRLLFLMFRLSWDDVKSNIGKFSKDKDSKNTEQQAV